jgi:fructuronate reductase
MGLDRSGAIPRLSDATLSSARGARTPRYDRAHTTAGIVHLGLGAFARAHVAVYCDDLLARGIGDAGIHGISLRSPATRDTLEPQDGLYTLIEAEGDRTELRVIGSVRQVEVGEAAAAAAIANVHTRAVTMTITEKGYARSGAAARAIVAGLRQRRELDLPPPVVVSCDNHPANGAVARAAVVDHAREINDDLATWIESDVAFPSTMVDRIVPATTDEDRDLVRQALGLDDAWPVHAEPYVEWVVERVPGLPAWDAVGARFVESVEPWETRKLRLLNGPHSALAYLGLLAGVDTIAAAIADPTLARLVEVMAVDEIVPTLPPVDGDPVAYAATVRQRFANSALGHRTAQVAEDGSQKLPQRILRTLRERAAQGAVVDRLALVVAAWMLHVERCAHGEATLVDPLADELTARVQSAAPGADGLADALLETAAVFETSDRTDPAVRTPVVDGLRLLEARGPLAAAAALTP